MTPDIPPQGMMAALTAALIITAIAAVTDARAGRIPNWLTLPPLALAPLTLGLLYGVQGLAMAGTGLLLCFLVPYLLFYARVMAGGDVKLFAAIGAIVGPAAGLEVQFYGICAAAMIALGIETKNGNLLQILRNTFFVAVNPVLPKKHRRKIPRESMSKIRLGIPIFIGTLIAAVMRAPGLLAAS